MSWDNKYRDTKKRLREKRIREGLCTDCGDITIDEKKKCLGCLEKQTIVNRARREKLKSNGLCGECGKNPVLSGQYRCDECCKSERICHTDGCDNKHERNKLYCRDCYYIKYKSTKIYYNKCEYCRKDYIYRIKTKYCSDECQYNRNLETHRDNYIPIDVVYEDRNCTECGGKYNANIKKDTKFCGYKCMRTAHRRDYNHKRRIKIKRAYKEHIRMSEVFRRDKGRCRICGIKFNINDKVPNLNAPTIDHIIPISCGGEHSYMNIQLACFHCNVIKGDRIVEGGEQLRMF